MFIYFKTCAGQQMTIACRLICYIRWRVILGRGQIWVCPNMELYGTNGLCS